MEMHRVTLSVLFLAFVLLTPVRAIEEFPQVGSPYYNTTAPTSSDIANWNTGWGTSGGETGWNYVGQINGLASGVYLGNGWALTAAHVPISPGDTFVVDGGSYTIGASQEVGTTDLRLFQISSQPSLPSLTLSGSPPVPFSQTQTGSSLAMLGFGNGGGTNETWGLDTVTQIDQEVDVSGFSSNDLFTINGQYFDGSASITNNAQVVLYDSGGGDFIFNTTTQTWELAGINEVTGSGTINGQNVTFSGMVQVNTYQSQIQGIIATPEPSTWALLGLGLASVWGYSRRRVS